MTARFMKLELWGKVSRGDDLRRNQGVGKEPLRYPEEQEKEEWRLLDHWDVDINDLKPLPREVCIFTLSVASKLTSLLSS